MGSVAEALALGTRHHQAGQLAEAERIYRQILAVEPDHAHALHQLGLLALQARQFPAAIELIGKAIQADRSQAVFYANLGEAQRHSGNLEQAILHYRNALKLQGDLAQVHVLLGGALHDQGQHAEAAAALREALRLKPDDVAARTRLGHVLVDQGKLNDAEICFRRVLRSEPKSALTYCHLAGIEHARGKLDAAVSLYRTALDFDPNLADAHNNLGTILREQDAVAEAIDHFEAALRAQPGHAAAHTNLGLVYDTQSRFDTAAECYRAALEADPGSLTARCNLATMLQRQGRPEAALAIFQEALDIQPDYVPALTGMSHVLQSLGRWSAAVTCCQRALQLDPLNAEACNNLGVAWSEQGRRDEAIAQFRRAIALRNGMAIAHGNLAVALQALGRLDEAIVEHRTAVELAPQNAGLHSNLLYALNYHPGYDAQTIFREHRAWGQRYADPLTAQSPPLANERAPQRRLRVGYVSPHFMAHAVNFFSEPILATHDREQFEVVCYSDVALEDETTSRLRRYADQWRNCVNLANEELADLIRQDKIDVLVDLTGHISGGKRLLVFARRAAPVQITYIGYQNTTGMLAMDYRLTDDYADPPGQTEALHTEELARLPGTFFCYLPSSDAPNVGTLPASGAGHVTFGSFNNFAKITPDVLRAWAAILSRVGRSKLLILGDMTDSLQARLIESFGIHGVGPERLELVHRVPRHKYLECIQRVDIALDPFPFNGHTTTCDCLWQGVPVVTLSGQTYVSRFGASAHRTLKLEDLVARTPEQYIDIASALAMDVERLAMLRGGLRDRIAASPLLDFEGFTRRLEAEFRRMWVRWCNA